MSDEKRKPYGEFGHVLLSDDDIRMLTEKFPGIYENYIEKKPYGEFGHVLLSNDDIKILKERFPGIYEDYIEQVDGYCESIGKKYENYRATIQNWIRRDRQSGKIKRAAAGVISHKPTYDINEISRRAVLNTEIKYKNQEVHNE